MSSAEFYAYPDGYRQLEPVMRFHAVKRWHMIDTTRQQTIAEHSANVALLAYMLAKTAPGMFFGPAAEFAMLGLLHDLGEVFTGDVPTHTKRHILGLDQLEEQVLPVLFEYRADINSRLLIKLCDLADGIRFIRLHGVDLTAQHAREGLELQLVQRKGEAERLWPESVFHHVSKNLHFYAYENS